jgi:hypothetical protein
MTGREDTPRQLSHQEIRNIFSGKDNQKVNYLLDPESGAWLEPPGPPPPSFSSSGLSGSMTGQHYQPGMTRGRGFQEFLSGGRDSSSINISETYHATEGQPDCRAKFRRIYECKYDTNFFLLNCGQPTNGRGGTVTNLEGRSPLDDATHHHHQLITSPTSDNGVIKSSKSS